MAVAMLVPYLSNKYNCIMQFWLDLAFMLFRLNLAMLCWYVQV